MLFVGGLGRSGTTLLERILAQLPGACPLGEVVHLWQRDVRDDERCGCGASFSDCDFWQQVGEHAFGGWDRVNVDRILRLRTAVGRTRHIPKLGGNRLSPDHFDLVREYVSCYRHIYQAAAKVSGANVVIDSSKHPSLAYCLRWEPGIDLRVAHMVRDSRGVAYSWTKVAARPESDGNLMTRYHPLTAALLWNTHNTALGRLGRRGVPVHRIRYEDLVADPLGAVKELAEFAGLDLGDLKFLSFAEGVPHAELAGCHSAAGNPMRFRRGRIPLRADHEWRTALPASQQRLVRALTRPLLGAYGYLN
ncbi:MAG: sulfotransferase [Micromonosporaceae bacterium]